MDPPKYVIIERDGLPHAQILAAYENHSDVLPAKVLGAGFVNIFVRQNKVAVVCYGKSVSLDVRSRVADTLLIRKLLGIGI